MQVGLFDGRIPYVRTGGPGPAIVVINGGNAFMRRFDERSAMRDARRIAPLFPPGTNLLVVGYDVTPDAGLRSGLRSMVEDVAAVVRAEAGMATIAAISFAGFIALRLAATHPELVRDVILIASAHRFSQEGRERVARQIADLERGDVVAMARPFMRLFRSRWRNALIGTMLWLRRRSLAARLNDPATVAHMLRTTTSADFDQTDWLSRIAARTLIVAGTRDQFFDRAAVESTAHSIPAARLVLFENETHMLPLERPRAVAAAIEAFLRSA
jgi:pimeloyl-ACP methyl ester carboxylesterase